MELHAHAIDPVRLDAMRAAGQDEHGNPFTVYPALGWEPLRCCLTVAEAGSPIVLISYTPLPAPSPWAETGPVFVHGERCAGHDPAAGLPAQLRVGPRVLRTYHHNRTLNYERIRTVPEGIDLEADLRELVALPDVGEVHVRALASQCFTYAVRAGGVE